MRVLDPMHVTYKAEHMQGSSSKIGVLASVQVRRVSLGDSTLSCDLKDFSASWSSRRITGVISKQDRSDSAPCAGVNSMVKLLRAHGGCLGRDRR